jgi:hypothetical protein
VNKKELIEELDIYIYMPISTRRETHYPSKPYTVESFPVTYEVINEHVMLNRLKKIQELWKKLKEILDE